MTLNDTRLAVTLKRLGDTSDGLADWVAANDRLIPGERVALQDEFAQVSSRAHVVASLVKQAPSLGIVGPPRSGKTHLLSSLAMRGAAPLLVKFDGIAQRLNVIRQVVPVGSRQYLGAAMRFGSKTRQLHRGFPLQLRLLSLAEVVQVLGGAALTALEDADRTHPTARDIRALHLDAEPHAGPDAVLGFTEMDALALRDYFCTAFGGEPYVQALTSSGYWDTLAELAPYVGDNTRTDLLSPLWASVPAFNQIFAKLTQALSVLGYGRDAACTLEALVEPDPQSGQLMRRVDSILSTRPLADLLTDDERPIVVCSEFAQWHTIDRAALTAIVAEVKFQIDAPPGSVQEQADLIEYPAIAPPAGRKRRDALGDAVVVARLFARAKQELLHTRAIANSEITSMLVCIDPDANGLGALAPLVADWVHRTHGISPESRETSDGGLFVVHTKLDRIVADASQRERLIDWDAQVDATLQNGFGRFSTWPSAWTPQRAFDAVTFVLAPAFKAAGLFDRGADREASKIKSGLRDRIARARETFLASDAVRRHVSDPAAVFDEAVTSGEGGITRLAKAILTVCHARTKRRHLFSEAARLRERVLGSSLRYCPGDMPHLPHDRRHGLALLVTRRLRSVAEQRRLNALMSAISISEADLVEVFRDLTSRAHATTDPLLARAAIDSWIGRIREVARRPVTDAMFGMPNSVVRHLVDDLVVGANRLNLEGRIIKEIDGACDADMPSDTRLEAAAMCAALSINGYVLHLGYDNLLANDHPRRRDQTDSAIFSPRDPMRDTGDDAFNPELDQCSDWTLAYHAFVEENARELRERKLAPEEALRLTNWLSGLDAVS